MRKFFNTYLPASLLLALLAMILVACGGGGGGGGDGGGGSAATLTGLSIQGPSSMSEFSTAAYTARASWSGGSSSSVVPSWSVNSQMATISQGGVLSCLPIDSDMTVTITATYSSGGVTESATMDVTITDATTGACTTQMLSGKVFYQESSLPGGSNNSNLFYFNDDFTFVQDWYEIDGISETDGRLTGSWSLSSGQAIVNVTGQGTTTVECLSESLTELQVSVDDGTGPPTTETLEKTVPVDPLKLPGTYLAQNGESWTFNSNGTGSTTGGGGWTFTWTVDSGILKIVFSSGYPGWFHGRASSQSTSSSYSVLKVGFVEYNPSGGFYKYYGGRDLTLQ